MDETRKRLVRLALRLAEMRGKWPHDKVMYSWETKDIRTVLFDVKIGRAHV